MIDVKAALAHFIGHEGLRLPLDASGRRETDKLSRQRKLGVEAFIDGGEQGRSGSCLTS